MEVKVSMANLEKHYCCSNPECRKTFDKPKLIKYYVCPHCMTKIEEKENKKEECPYFFGYLNQKNKNKPIPKNCIECGKVLECMLNKNYSQTAVEEIKKWY